MENAPKAERFLEPVYLNESMVLNCAAYLFKGYSTEAAETKTTEKRKEGGFKASVPLLADLVGLSGSTGTTSVDELQAARQFTAGSLHMDVLNFLYKEKMIKSVTAGNLDAGGLVDTYVDVHAVLKPSEYQSLLGVIKTLGPLVAQLARDFGGIATKDSSVSAERWNQIEPEIAKYEESVLGIVTKLERDYLTSKQLDMVMLSKNKKALGVVDLDVTGHDAAQLRAKLSGGHYHVIGKVVARADRGETISLMQKTMLLEVAELVKRFVVATNSKRAINNGTARTSDRDGSELSAAEFISQAAKYLSKINEVVNLEVPGPAIRVAAMSVCL